MYQAQRLVAGEKEGGHRRWGRMDLESGGSNTLRMGFKSLISTALVSTSQEIARQLNPNDQVHQKAWMKVH